MYPLRGAISSKIQRYASLNRATAMQGLFKLYADKILVMKTVQTNIDAPLWEKITAYSKVQAEMIFRLDGRRLVSRRDLRRIWDCSDETIKKYTKLGMPKVNIEQLLHEGFERARLLRPGEELLVPQQAIYDLATVNAWRDENIAENNGRGAEKKRKALLANTPPPPPEDVESDNPNSKVGDANYALREMIAKTTSAEEQATILTLKRKNLEGQLVEAEDLDKAMAEQAILHKTDKINDEKVLPTLLEMKSASEISKILYEHNQERLSHFDKIINKEFSCPETLYNVIEAVLAKMRLGCSPKEIVEAINA